MAKTFFDQEKLRADQQALQFVALVDPLLAELSARDQLIGGLWRCRARGFGTL